MARISNSRVWKRTENAPVLEAEFPESSDFGDFVNFLMKEYPKIGLNYSMLSSFCSREKIGKGGRRIISRQEMIRINRRAAYTEDVLHSKHFLTSSQMAEKLGINQKVFTNKVTEFSKTVRDEAGKKTMLPRFIPFIKIENGTTFGKKQEYVFPAHVADEWEQIITGRKRVMQRQKRRSRQVKPLREPKKGKSGRILPSWKRLTEAPEWEKEFPDKLRLDSFVELLSEKYPELELKYLRVSVFCKKYGIGRIENQRRVLSREDMVRLNRIAAKTSDLTASGEFLNAEQMAKRTGISPKTLSNSIVKYSGTWENPETGQKEVIPK